MKRDDREPNGLTQPAGRVIEAPRCEETDDCADNGIAYAVFDAV